MKKLLNIFFSFFILLTTLNIHSQYTQEWVRRYTDTSSAIWNAHGIKSDNSGNIYVLGETGNDFGFLKYSPTGTLLNVATYWPGGYDYGGGLYLEISQNGDIYISGPVEINLNEWMYTVKYNNSGSFVWGKAYAIDNSDIANDMKIDKDNNVILGGASVNGSNVSSLILKYNSNGDTLWTRHFNNGQNPAGIEKICLDDSNNIYTAGYITFRGKCLSLKYSSAGNLLWLNSFTFDTTESNIGKGISVDLSGNIYIIGMQSRPTTEDSYLLKLNNNGITQWAKPYGNYGSGNESLWGPVISSDGNSIYYTGTKHNTSIGLDIATFKYNSLGDTQWVKLYNGGPNTGLNLPYGIILDKINNIYITGIGNFTGTGNDFVTIKYLPSGVLQWVATYTGEINNGADYASGLLVDSNFSVYIVGRSTNLHGGLDAVTIKYNQPLGIKSNNNHLPQKFKLEQNYPNPFNPVTVISYDIPENAEIKLSVFNIVGEEVKTLVDRKQESGHYNVTFNIGNFSSGIYFCKMTANGNLIDTKKMIMIK